MARTLLGVMGAGDGVTDNASVSILPQVGLLVALTEPLLREFWKARLACAELAGTRSCKAAGSLPVHFEILIFAHFSHAGASLCWLPRMRGAWQPGRGAWGWNMLHPLAASASISSAGRDLEAPAWPFRTTGGHAGRPSFAKVHAGGAAHLNANCTFKCKLSLPLLPPLQGNGRCLALTETLPGTYQIDSDSLETLGRVRFTDGIKGDITTAHPTVLPNGDLINILSTVRLVDWVGRALLPFPGAALLACWLLLAAAAARGAACLLVQQRYRVRAGLTGWHAWATIWKSLDSKASAWQCLSHFHTPTLRMKLFKSIKSSLHAAYDLYMQRLSAPSAYQCAKRTSWGLCYKPSLDGCIKTRAAPPCSVHSTLADQGCQSGAHSPSIISAAPAAGGRRLHFVPPTRLRPSAAAQAGHHTGAAPGGAGLGPRLPLLPQLHRCGWWGVGAYWACESLQRSLSRP